MYLLLICMEYKIELLLCAAIFFYYQKTKVESFYSISADIIVYCCYYSINTVSKVIRCFSETKHICALNLECYVVYQKASLPAKYCSVWHIIWTLKLSPHKIQLTKCVEISADFLSLSPVAPFKTRYYCKMVRLR